MQAPEGDRPLPDEGGWGQDDEAPAGGRRRERQGSRAPEARHGHAPGRHHRHASHVGADLAAGARRRIRGLPWRPIARVTGAIFVVATIVLGARGLLFAALALAIGLVAERVVRRPVALERDRSRRHLRRNLGVGITTAVAIALYALSAGNPYAPPRPIENADDISVIEDHRARRFAELAGVTALGAIGLSLLLFGFDRSAERRARRRRPGRGRDAAAPA